MNQRETMRGRVFLIITFVILSFGLLLASCEMQSDDDDDGKNTQTTEEADIESLQTTKLPSKFTMKAPGAMNNASRTRSIEYAEINLEYVNNNILLLEDIKLEIAMQFLIFDSVLADIETSDSTHAEVIVPLEGELKNMVAPFLEESGINPDDVPSYAMGEFVYKDITEGDYAYYFFQDNSDTNEVYKLTVKWSADKTKVFVQQEVDSTEAGVGQQLNVFTFDETTKSAEIAMWADTQPIGASSNMQLYFTMSMKAEAGSTANGAYFNISSFDFPDTDTDYIKIDTRGFADDNGGFFESDYTGNSTEGQTPFAVTREAIRVGFDAAGLVIYSGTYNISYGTADGWVDDSDDITVAGDYATKYFDNFSSDTLVNANFIEQVFAEDDNVKYYDLTGAAAGDLFYITTETLDTFEQTEYNPETDMFETVSFQPALRYLNNEQAAIPYDLNDADSDGDTTEEHPDYEEPVTELGNKMLGIASGIGDGRIMLGVINPTLYGSAASLYIYKYDTTHPRKFELYTPSSISK